MRRRRAQQFEQPSLVPMADMVTNTVGIMLFILIFVTLSAGGAIVSRRLPREKRTNAKVVWMFCTHGRIVSFDPTALDRQLEIPLGAPTYYNADAWAHRFAAQKLETASVTVSGEADAIFDNENGSRDARIKKYLLIRHKPSQGDDQTAIATPGSAFQNLISAKDKNANFFFFFVSGDSIRLFRSARDLMVHAGFAVGWSPLGPDEPARISMSGGGREATIQ